MQEPPAHPPTPEGESETVRRTGTDLAAALRREAAGRYARMAEQWSPRTRRRAESYLGAGLAAMRAFVSTRLSGLAAEIAFWGVFAAPWVVLGIVAGLSTLQDTFGLNVVDELEQRLLATAGRVFNETAMTSTIEPMVDNLFSYGSGGLSLVAFVVALWSGSKLVSTAVQGVVLVSGQEYEGYMRTRARALLVYAVGLVGLVAALVLVFVGPDLAESLLGFGGRILYWVLLPALVVLLLWGLYIFSPRIRPRLRDALPGALAATAAWVLASLGLRLYVQTSAERGSLYAVVGTPIALLLWAYLTAYVVLLGALFNRLLVQVRESRVADVYGPPPARVPDEAEDPP